MYELNNSKIVGMKYLGIQDLMELMKNLEIVPHKIGIPKFIYTCFWYQVRP